MREDGRVMDALRSPAKSCIWSRADGMGLVASLANRITLRRVDPGRLVSGAGSALATWVGGLVSVWTLDCFSGGAPVLLVGSLGCRVRAGPLSRLPGPAKLLV
jgi:hypothetical protein